MRHIATHPRGATLRCTYDNFTVDHRLNQVLAAGLKLASKMMQSADLRLDLARAADRFFGDLIYGLAYQMAEPREVLILHPLTAEDTDRATSLIFAPAAAKQQVRIRLVGVQVDGILDGSVRRWWPL